ncbi:hypothetical protein BD289DRAFT_450808 [Coniella lustricola]|uniref:Zn(2)-C6 fungal-type domain-containing protein n=1 Tax=Coniella lustricola TaxID=2025994 RepID=A0A2T3AHF1_9PEZI|nr:hypothetical protein BD289DRAFT_450808 [Coniella lustricola]
MAAQPYSRLERENPPPRRKSCAECVRAKRRCSQTLPQCLRCTQRQLRCQYPAQARGLRRSRATPQPSTPAPAIPELPGAAGDFTVDDAFPNQDFWLDTGTQAVSLDLDKSWSGDVQCGAQAAVVPRAQIALEDIHQQFQDKLQYALDIIKRAPQDMLLGLETPWSHPLLYKDEMPEVMQGALSACALYNSKTAVNGPVIMRCIDAKVKSLLATEPADGFLQALSRTQALILYQIMRFFDGDIAARSSADAMFADLHSSACALASYIDWEFQPRSSLDSKGLPPSLSSFADFDMASSRKVWKQWFLNESARRTFLIACFFANSWRMLTGRQVAGCSKSTSSSHHELYFVHKWTLSAHLWNAKDAYAFSVAWRDKNHYVVRRNKILSTLADAHGDDVDLFGKMLLTVALGIDGAKAWLALKGGSL